MDYSQLIASNLSQANKEQIDPYKIWIPSFPHFGTALRKLLQRKPNRIVVQVVRAE